MKPSEIFIFGNPRIHGDSIPLKILPDLQKRFPQIKFKVRDPTEIVTQDEEGLWIIDTVQGIDDVGIIDDLSMFENRAKMSVHDYDLVFDISLLFKLGKVKKVKIIAIPQEISRNECLEKVTKLLKASGF